MADSVRNSWPHPALLRGDFAGTGEARRAGGSLRFSVGRGFPVDEFRQRAKPMVFEPSSFHRPGGRRFFVSKIRPEESARAALRYCREWDGPRWGFDSYSSARIAEDRVRRGEIGRGSG